MLVDDAVVHPAAAATQDVAAGDVVATAAEATLVLVHDPVVHPAGAVTEDVATRVVVAPAEAALVLVDDPVVHPAAPPPRTSPPLMLSPPAPLPWCWSTIRVVYPGRLGHDLSFVAVVEVAGVGTLSRLDFVLAWSVSSV